MSDTNDNSTKGRIIMSAKHVPCKNCGRRDLPLHTNYQCAECGPTTPKSGEHTEGERGHKAEPTPTPLFARKCDEIPYPYYQIERESDGLRSVVAKISDATICPEHGDAEAYAMLIVRAVNSHEALLEALKDVLDGEGDITAERVARARRAIAQAEGRA